MSPPTPQTLLQDAPFFGPGGPQSADESKSPYPSSSPLPPTNDTKPSDVAPKASQPWKTCLNYAKNQAKSEVKAWKDEIGNLLLFATLFSGVVGAFSVDSYHSLQEDPAEVTVLLLKSILALQLNATSALPSGDLSIDLDPKIPIPASTRRVSIYNFLSLVLSLGVVMAGILGLQWLREFETEPSGGSRSHRDHLGIRYMRHQGMKEWGVFTVLRMLPLILLLALLLFFAALIELLLPIDQTVAIVVAVVVGLAALFIVVTTVLPVLLIWRVRWLGPHRLTQCPWKSPQSLVLYQIIDWVTSAPRYYLRAVASKISRLFGRHQHVTVKNISLPAWSAYDWLVYDSSKAVDVGSGIIWLGGLHLQEQNFAEAFYECIQDSSMQSWLIKFIGSEKDGTRRLNAINKYETMTFDDIEDKSDRARKYQITNVTVLEALECLIRKFELGDGDIPQPILLKERLALFIKINEFHSDGDINCPLIGSMAEKALKSYAVRKALLNCICNIMKKDGGKLNPTHLEALIDIFDYEANEQPPNTELFDTALVALRRWFAEESTKPQILNTEKSLVLKRAHEVKEHIGFLQELIKTRAQAHSHSGTPIS